MAGDSPLLRFYHILRKYSMSNVDRLTPFYFLSAISVWENKNV